MERDFNGIMAELNKDKTAVNITMLLKDGYGMWIDYDAFQINNLIELLEEKRDELLEIENEKRNMEI
jgi:septin family protein